MTRRIRRLGDRGSATVEAAILTPAVLLLIGVVLAGGRVALASESITGVAGTAARDASLARTPTDAQAAATRAAQDALTAAGLHCATIRVTVDVTGFAAPPGTPAAVRVDVACTVTLNALGIPLLPGSRTITDHATSPLDPWRGQR